MALVIVTLTLSISAYTPGANRISGGNVMANGSAPHWGAFACPAAIPLGSLVELQGDVAKRAAAMGLPTSGICADRFHRAYSTRHLDICIPQDHDGLNNAQRLTWAFQWGRRRGAVRFTLPDGILRIPRR